ncbi:TadE family protein [Desulfovibrio sp. X2]|uniref:TadE/TadG family type IV pilus assembly protein n=1 Tax=Desulfovibrio sp. X2 TaxID=941449 RepID=UPI000358AB83|nr:TadE/TadG family type IV pilus assembly protein [Desulfovibrio sp. X2]EPR44153.1 TadE family protein [Desulfovibrio sp. X2]
MNYELIRRLIRGRESERGVMAVEFALVLPMLVLLFGLMVEGANAVRVYATLVDASREAARTILRDGNSTEAPAVVKALTADLSGNSPTTSVTTDSATNTVTVEVQYAYQSFYGADGLLNSLIASAPVFKARTTMPLS